MSKYEGQTVEQVQAAQISIMERIYKLMGTPAYTEDVKNAICAEYAETVTWLVEKLGRNAPAGDVDMDQFEVYCNVYKDENGFKPRGHTYAQMEVYMYNKWEPKAEYPVIQQ